MFLVNLATSLTKAVSTAKIKRAEKKNAKAMMRLHKAKGNLDDSSFDLKATQAEVMIQLTKLNKVSEDISRKTALNDSRQEKVNALLASLEE